MEVAHLSLIKYRVHEVAKDFNVNSKVIAEILTKYATKPATHQKVLEDDELSIIFDYMTQHNQVESIESIFADVYHEPVPAAPKEPEKAAPAAAPAAKSEPKPKAAPQQQSVKEDKPAAPAPQQPQNRPTTRVPEKKVVDTR